MYTPLKKAVWVLLCLTSFWACKHDDEPFPNQQPNQPTTEEPDYSTGKITEVGIPEGIPASATIGPSGGSLTSSDGRATLTFPSGALSANTTITIEPISNKIPNGKGIAYRFSPDGQQFKKPVVLTFQYSDEDLNGTTAEALDIAYQDKKGYWLAMSTVTANTTNKTVTASIKHFSDWALTTRYVLVPEKATLKPNESVDLQVKIIKYRFYTSDTLDLLLEGEEIASASSIKSWKVNGQNAGSSTAYGSLVGSGSTITYKAPATAPVQNPVAISVEVEGPKGKKVYLVSNITITGKKWHMDIEWLRINTCTIGSIATSKYTCSASIDFELNVAQQIINAQVTNLNDALVTGITSCNPLFYSATGTAKGINITGMEGGVDANTGKLKFNFQGNFMDFPTYTLQYKDGSSSVTEESFITFEVFNTFTQMPLKSGEILDMRTANKDAGFTFTLSRVE